MKCDICDKVYLEIIKMRCGKHKACFSCIDFLIEREIKEKEEWSMLIK